MKQNADSAKAGRKHGPWPLYSYTSEMGTRWKWGTIGSDPDLMSQNLHFKDPQVGCVHTKIWAALI